MKAAILAHHTALSQIPAVHIVTIFADTVSFPVQRSV
jgi:hypothetical protein